MRKLDSDFEILQEIIDFKNKTILDIGCGTGDMVRSMTNAGANVIGIDTPEMLKRARGYKISRNEKYLEGGGEDIPIEDSIVDVILFIASFHHIPIEKINTAFSECNRVLKKGGEIVIIEPVSKQGSYYDIIKLVEDEVEIQSQAYKAIKISPFEQIEEQFFYIERSFKDYIQLLNIFIEFDQERELYIREAKEITIELAKQEKVNLDDYRYKSISRLNILRKK